MIRSGYSMAQGVIIITLIVKHLSVLEDVLWERLLELTWALPTPAWRLWRVESRKLYPMKKADGLRLRALESRKPGNGWWCRALSGRPLPIPTIMVIPSSGLWDCALALVPKNE